MVYCPLCEKHKNEDIPYLVYENEILIVTHGPLDSQILGYFYIVPKRHIENWYELMPEEYKEIGRILSCLSEFLRDELDADRVYTVTISEVVRHLHIHVIPRSGDQQIKGLSLIEQATQSRKKTEKNVTEEEIKNLIKVLKKSRINLPLKKDY
ncbi:HIT family protein [Niallia circulans]|uniref:HIT family protein n=1 Tax=Niallia circulans TaxID=1397 RepID=UPI001F24B0B6|nr:HIT family protein [Niallia circulans]MCF2649121.1 HIT family protein [Niallia circulans]